MGSKVKLTRRVLFNMSALEETLGVERLEFGETLTGNADGNPERRPFMVTCREQVGRTCVQIGYG